MVNGVHGPTGPDVVYHVVAARRAELAITIVMVKVKRKMNCAMIPVVQFGMIGPSGHLVRLLVVVANSTELRQMFALMYPTLNKCELALPLCLMILITCGKNGDRVLLLAKVVAECVKLNMSAEPVVVLMQSLVDNRVFGWNGISGHLAQLPVVLVRCDDLAQNRVDRLCPRRKLPNVNQVPEFTQNGPVGQCVQLNALEEFLVAINIMIAVLTLLSKREHVVKIDGHCGQHGRLVHQLALEHDLVANSTIVDKTQLSNKKDAVVEEPI